MVSPSVSVPDRKRSPALRLGLFFLLAVIVVAAAIAGWFFWVARSALPQLDGTLHVAGLSAPITVIRDHHGVPTIEAANFDDLFFAQGYVTAQDRLWQMDIIRRAAAGELSEILGEKYVEFDREQRILGMREAARKNVTIASDEDRERMQAYARGVNAFIESHRDRLPLEFRILRYSPRPWTADDSASVAVQMVKDLNHDPHQLAHEKILDKLGPDLTADLYVNSSWHDRPPTQPKPSFGDSKDQTTLNAAPADSSLSLQATAPELADPPYVLGSNNWVVSGAHTVSGKPLLSNDMHLGHQMPNLWYETHLLCGNFDVAGVSLPGLPYVVVGHNQRIAWGFTNLGPTVEDLYIEEFNSQGQYLTPEGWKNPDHRREVIHVKGRPDVVVDVVVTRHGPIVSSLLPGETRQIALRWTLYDGTRDPLFDVDAAQNWDAFRQAFSKFDAPAQNVVYADVDGNVGYQATGRIPIRASGDGGLPENGSDNAHEWIAYVSFDKLPSVLNPPSGVAATANARITPDDYPYSLSTQWEAPWRTARIYHVLESGKKFSTADMLGLQTDIYSDWDNFCAQRFVYAIDHAKNATSRAKQAADILRGWDGRMRADSAAPTLTYHSRMELMRLLLEPKLGAAPDDPKQQELTLNWRTYRWGMQSVWLENVILHQPARWLPHDYANYDELLAAAVDAAVKAPEAPQNLRKWNWGGSNPVEIDSPVLGQIPLLGRWAAPGIQPQSGSGYTVKAVTRHHGPSERMTVDFANLDRSTLNTVTGQSGNFLSPYYMDQWKAWYEGFTFPLPFSPEAVDKSKSHTLTLEP